VRPQTGIDLERFFALPTLRPEAGGPAQTLARRPAGDVGTHVVSYGAEAGQFQDAG
jgi:acetylornithine deacetylase